jgi:hypothetical protein
VVLCGFILWHLDVAYLDESTDILLSSNQCPPSFAPHLPSPSQPFIDRIISYECVFCEQIVVMIAMTIGLVIVFVVMAIRNIHKIYISWKRKKQRAADRAAGRVSVDDRSTTDQQVAEMTNVSTSSLTLIRSYYLCIAQTLFVVVYSQMKKQWIAPM